MWDGKTASNDSPTHTGMVETMMMMMRGGGSCNLSRGEYHSFFSDGSLLLLKPLVSRGQFSRGGGGGGVLWGKGV